MGFWNDVTDFAEDIYDGAKDVGETIIDTAEDVADAVTGAAEEIGEWVDDEIIDPAFDAAGDAIDWVEDAAEWTEDRIEDTWEAIADGAEGIMEDFSELVKDAWDSATDAIDDAWDWVTEKVDDAIDWCIAAAEKVYEFVVEEAIPFIISLVELIPTVIMALGALLVLPLCYLYKEIFGEEESTILEGISAHESRLMEEFDVARLPAGQKYVVFSDLHMYTAGDLDFFNNNGNSELYQAALTHYAAPGNSYHLIELGDIEDFWMRGGSAMEAIFSISDYLPWPYMSASFESAACLSANQLHALNVFAHNQKTYGLVKRLFHSKKRFTRVIGNHDDVWSDPSFDFIMQLQYPNLVVNDYATLEKQDGETEAIMAHGHQSDIFNTPMCNFAGKAMTDLASKIHELSRGEWNMFSKAKESWEADWSGHGLPDELQDTNLLKQVSFSECALYKDLENIYGNSFRQPYLILGHTHRPKDNAGIPDFILQDSGNWNEYSNSGTAGMWEGVVFGLEISFPNVTVVAWRYDSQGCAKRHTLKEYRSGDTYLKPS